MFFHPTHQLVRAAEAVDDDHVALSENEEKSAVTFSKNVTRGLFQRFYWVFKLW
jgi:hypothetical protein